MVRVAVGLADSLVRGVLRNLTSLALPGLGRAKTYVTSRPASILARCPLARSVTGALAILSTIVLMLLFARAGVAPAPAAAQRSRWGRHRGTQPANAAGLP